MNELRFDTSDTPHLLLNDGKGKVTIGSWIRPAVTITGLDFTAESLQADLVTVNATADMEIMLPQHSRLTIENIQGDLEIKHISGLIKIGQVQGALTLKQVGNVQVDYAHDTLEGDGLDGPFILGEIGGGVNIRNSASVEIRRAGAGVSIRYANGHVVLGDVTGDIALHTISGDLTISRAGASLRLSNLGGVNQLPNAQGPLFLVGGLVNGEHTITADGDIFVYWPSTARVNLIATAAHIDNYLSLRQAVETSEEGKMTLTGYIADRKAYLILKSPQRIALAPWDSDEDPAFASADFVAPPPKPIPTPESSPTSLEDVLAASVTSTINQIELELGPEWGRRFAAIELEEKLVAAISAKLARHSWGEQPAPTQETITLPATTPGTIAFQQAEIEVQRSLQQAEDTMDQTRARLTDPVVDEAEGTAVSVESAPAEREPPDPAAIVPPTPTPAPEPEAPVPLEENDAPSRSTAQLKVLALLEQGTLTFDEASKLLQLL